MSRGCNSNIHISYRCDYQRLPEAALSLSRGKESQGSCGVKTISPTEAGETLAFTVLLKSSRNGPVLNEHWAISEHLGLRAPGAEWTVGIQGRAGQGPSPRSPLLGAHFLQGGSASRKGTSRFPLKGRKHSGVDISGEPLPGNLLPGW